MVVWMCLYHIIFECKNKTFICSEDIIFQSSIQDPFERDLNFSGFSQEQKILTYFDSLVFFLSLEGRLDRWNEIRSGTKKCTTLFEEKNDQEIISCSFAKQDSKACAQHPAEPSFERDGKVLALFLGTLFLVLIPLLKVNFSIIRHYVILNWFNYQLTIIGN